MERQLTARERQVIEALARGRQYKEVADDLDMSTETVKKHVGSIYKKLGVKNCIEAINAFRLQPNDALDKRIFDEMLNYHIDMIKPAVAIANIKNILYGKATTYARNGTTDQGELLDQERLATG